MKKTLYTYEERTNMSGIGSDMLNLEFAWHRLIKCVYKTILMRMVRKFVIYIDNLIQKK